jgi:RNA polymerase sigma factor (sigma-70 family)
MTRNVDADRIDALYRSCLPGIRRRARQLLQNNDEALDVGQEVFEDFIRNNASWRNEAKPFTFLYQIATHKALDRLRHRARWSGVLVSLDIEEGERSGHLGVSDPLRGGLLRIETLHDLSLLTEGEDPRTLTATVLYWVEGYSLEELARFLGLERHAVSKLLKGFARRVQQRLRDRS